MEQLVAREVLQRVHQRLAGVAQRVEPGALEHFASGLAQQRDPRHGLGVGRAREQAEEPALPDDLARVVERLDADVVEVRRPVNGRTGVRLRQHEQGLLPRLRLDRRRQLAEGRRHVLVEPQDAEPGAGHGAQHVVLAIGLEPVLAVAEEREVVLREPPQQVPPLGDLGVGQRELLLVELIDEGEHHGMHLGPVLDGHADVGQYPLQRLLEGCGVVLVADPGDLDLHPRLADRALGCGHRAVLDARDAAQLAGDVALDVHLRVDHDPDVAVLVGELHGERVDEERHVVGDDLDRAVAAGRPALVAVRGHHPNPRGALRADASQLEVGGKGAVQVVRTALADVLRRDVAVVGADQRPGAHRAIVLLGCFGQPGGLLVVERDGHNPDTRTPDGARSTRVAAFRSLGRDPSWCHDVPQRDGVAGRRPAGREGRR